MNGDIFVNIDAIVLRGLGRSDHDELRNAVYRVLTEQLSSDARFTTLDRSRLRIDITLPDNFGSEQLGEVLGRSLGRVVTNRNGPQRSTDKSSEGAKDHG